MSVPNVGHYTAFLQCAFQVPLSIGINMQESHQELKEEPGVLEDCFSHHSSADHHLQGKLLVKMLDDKHKKTLHSRNDNLRGQRFFVFTNTSFPSFFLFLPIVIACQLLMHVS